MTSEGSPMPPGRTPREAPGVSLDRSDPNLVSGLRGVTDGDGNRIASILGLDFHFQAQQRVDHTLHLVFLGATVPDHASLDLKRRILAHLKARFSDGHQNDSAGMRKL